mmetsp:Transcript_38257/g.108161  ORF Transcript_38257/g.108161 Transcript_38257/m.108161 type:complete len:225 (+) Transcript_38257:348-1022(+)
MSLTRPAGTGSTSPTAQTPSLKVPSWRMRSGTLCFTCSSTWVGGRSPTLSSGGTPALPRLRAATTPAVSACPGGREGSPGAARRFSACQRWMPRRWRRSVPQQRSTGCCWCLASGWRSRTVPGKLTRSGRTSCGICRSRRCGTPAGAAPTLTRIRAPTLSGSRRSTCLCRTADRRPPLQLWRRFFAEPAGIQFHSRGSSLHKSKEGAHSFHRLHGRGAAIDCPS